MAGIYIHIPFCKQACTYCDFHFSTVQKNRTLIVKSIIKEIQFQKNFFDRNSKINTIYFGGGTPSLLNELELNNIIQAIQSNFLVTENPEITLECNPDDLSQEYLKIVLQKVGINRLSIGIQAFQNHILKRLNRSHNSTQAINSIKWAQDIGFENITIDLIYGIPIMMDNEWEENVRTFIKLNIPHLSAYTLTVEKKTVLAHQVKTQIFPKLSDEQSIRNFNFLIKNLSKSSIEQYEISNFSKPKYISKHNSNYWLGVPYLGIGPSAHSFNGNNRYWNISNNKKYLESLEKNVIPNEMEILSEKDKFNEYILTRLRTKWGLDLEFIKTSYANEFTNPFFKAKNRLLSKGLLVKSKNIVRLADDGILMADAITSELMI